MSDKVLYLALIISVIGLIILGYASERLEPPLSNIDAISTNHLGESVHILGSVTGTHKFKGGSALLKVDDGSSEIDVYVPYTTASEIDIRALQGKTIDIIGTVEIYDGRLEIVVESSKNIKAR